ncbi:MAG: hypothetical protein J1E37_03125 [Prevotella sp.]|nr:hypothetical protein [Prevotella sp.]
MKKTYIIPEMEVVKIATIQQMLAGSLPKSDDVVTNENDVLGRGSDDDWE